MQNYKSFSNEKNGTQSFYDLCVVMEFIEGDLNALKFSIMVS